MTEWQIHVVGNGLPEASRCVPTIDQSRCDEVRLQLEFSVTLDDL